MCLLLCCPDPSPHQWEQARAERSAPGQLHAVAFFTFCRRVLHVLPSCSSRAAVVFFTYYTYGGGKSLAADLDWVLLCSVAVLPAVGFLLIAYLRRERCLGELARGEGSCCFDPWIPGPDRQTLRGPRAGRPAENPLLLRRL